MTKSNITLFLTYTLYHEELTDRFLLTGATQHFRLTEVPQPSLSQQKASACVIAVREVMKICTSGRGDMSHKSSCFTGQCKSGGHTLTSKCG